MIKIIDERKKEKVKMPTLPFITDLDGDMFLYFQKEGGRIDYIDLETGVCQGGNYENIEEVINCLDTRERIVTAEIYLID